MPQLTPRQVVLIAAAVLLFATLVVGIYGLVSGPPRDGSREVSGGPRHSVTNTTQAPPVSETSAPDPTRVALPNTNDPFEFAQSVARSLFDWDTASGFLPTDYQAPVLADADPSGAESPGLVTDVATYMPTLDQWLTLATMHVAQSLVIGSTGVPASWATTVARAHGEIRPGTTAVTITGTRERRGVWNGDPVATSSPVSFTVFVACKPAFDHCYLLRLSQLDNPLR